MDPRRFALAITALCSAFSKEVTGEILEAYRIGLEDLDIDAIEAGVREAIRRHKGYMPVPALVREFCGAGEELAIEGAWQQAVALVRGGKGALGGTKENASPEVEAAVQMIGGWSHLSEQDSKEIHTWTRKRFVEALRVVRDRQAEVCLEDPGEDLRRLFGGIGKGME